MLKTLARRIPQIGRLVRQRDSLVREVERLRHLVTGMAAFDRRSLILQHLNLSGLGLEIGPSHNPLLPKSQGFRVETIDHADANHLREKYRALGQDVSRIEEVDYISGGGSIFQTIGKPGRYDYIAASHVIEHIPDILGFLKDCEKLLKPGGRVSLAVPDKRYCFDVFQPLSTTGQVLQAHIDRASRPGPGTIFDHFGADRLHGRTRAKRSPASFTIRPWRRNCTRRGGPAQNISTRISGASCRRVSG